MLVLLLMTRGWRRLPGGARTGDVLLALLAGALELLSWGGDRELVTGGRLPLWVVPVATVLLAGLLLLRRRHPFPVLVVQCLWGLMTVAVPLYVPWACILVALYTVAAHSGRRVALLGLAVAAVPLGQHAYSSAFVSSPRGDPLVVLLQAAGVWVVVAGVVWGLGRLGHATERRAELAREQALEAERLRLARDLHDSVTGAVTAMIMHAAGARAQVAGGQVHDALAIVERAGVQAMNELHRMLGLLRSPEGELLSAEATSPELTSVGELVERHRAGGLAATLEVLGEPGRLDPSVDQAAYRVVQESLLNAAKHGGPRVDVRTILAWGADELRIDVFSGRDVAPGPAVPSSGFGLRGLAERVQLVGGTFSAGPAGEGWLVRVVLPLSGRPLPSAPVEEGRARTSSR